MDPLHLLIGLIEAKMEWVHK